MTSRDVLLARAAALRVEARYLTGMPKARTLSKAAECERIADGEQRLTTSEPEPITCVGRRNGAPAIVTAGPLLRGLVGKELTVIDFTRHDPEEWTGGFLPEPEDRPSCAFGCAAPAVSGDGHGRCETCAYEGLRPCAGYDCGAVTSDDAGYCRRCREERDDCAREDAADHERDINF